MPRRRGRGEGSVEQLPSGNWRAIHARSDRDSVRIRDGKTFATKGEALAWLRERQAESARMPAGASAGNTTLAEWFERWHAGRKDVVSSRTNYDDQWRWGKHIAPHLGSMVLRKLTAPMVSDWLAKLADAGASGADRKASGALLRKVLYGAVAQGLLSVSPMRGVKLPRAIRPEKIALTAEQVRAVIQAAPERYRPMFLLWFDAGLRPGELFALRWQDVSLDRSEIFVCRALDDLSRQIKETKTTKGRRLLAISAATRDALATIRPADGVGLVFPSPRTDRPWHGSNFLRNVFGPTIKRAGVKCRPYDVRHTTATLLISAGVSVKVVSERLGHEDIQTTLRHYAHVMPGQQAAAASVMGQILIAPREPHEQKQPPTTSS